MRGSIATRQTCPACGQRGRYALRDFGRGRRALVCQCGGHIADRLELVVKWRGTTYRLTHDEAGQRFTDYVHAERGLGAVNNQIERKAFYPELWRSARHNKLLWENYLAAYLEAEGRRLLPERRATWQKKRVMVERLVAAFPGQNVREIRTAQVEDYANSPGLRAALSPKSLADLLAELRHIFARAVTREDIERAPRVPAVEVPRKVLQYMTQAQQAQVLAHIPDEHLPIFMFLMDYGVRVGEACALCWDKLDLAQEVFVVARTLSRRRLSAATKTRRENALPIMGWFAGYLQGVPVGIGETPVFRNPQADPSRNPARFYLPEFLEGLWAQALAAAELAPLPLKNGTRHSLGKRLRDQGWDPHLIARMLGHASTHHTMRTYVQDDAEVLRQRLTALAVVTPLSTGKDPKKDSGG